MDAAAVRALAEAAATGVCWSAATADLNVNLLAWPPGHRVENHVNDAVDVAVVVLHGSGVLTVGERVVDLGPGATALIPRGARRSIEARTRLLYLSIHRCRPGLVPAPLRVRET